MSLLLNSLKETASVGVFTILCSSTFTGSPICAQETLKKLNYKVMVEVSADDQIKSYVETYVKRYLRNISDVTVSDVEPDWKLSIVAISSELKGGQVIGYTTSTVALGFFDLLSYLDSNLKARKDYLKYFCRFDQFQSPCEERMDSIFTVDRSTFKNVPSTYRFGGHWLKSGSNLEKQCESIVMNFNSDCLEGERETNQMMSEMLDKLQNTIRDVKKKFEKQQDSTKR